MLKHSVLFISGLPASFFSKQLFGGMLKHPCPGKMAHVCTCGATPTAASEPGKQNAHCLLYFKQIAFLKLCFSDSELAVPLSFLAHLVVLVSLGPTKANSLEIWVSASAAPIGVAIAPATPKAFPFLQVALVLELEAGALQELGLLAAGLFRGAPFLFFACNLSKASWVQWSKPWLSFLAFSTWVL